MSDPTILPPVHVYDETGQLLENYVENEERLLEDRTIRAVTARFGAFYIDGFQIRDANGVDVPKSKYQYMLYNDLLANKTGKDVVGGVIITDPTVQAPVYIDYHCVGGPWGVSNENIIDLFYKLQVDSRPTSWPNILGKPDGYKPAAHLQDIGSLFGAEYFVAAIERLTQAYLMGDNASHDEIWRRMDDNYTELKTMVGSSNGTYNTYVDQQVASLKASLDALSARLDNMNTTLTAADTTTNTRITNVQNTLQTNINTVDGRLTNVRIELLASDNALSSRIDALGTQSTGLADVYTKINNVRTELLGDIATVDQRVTNLTTSTTNSINGINSTINSHTNNHLNPHQVTASEVGAYDTAASDRKESDMYIVLNSLTNRVYALEHS